MQIKLGKRVDYQKERAKKKIDELWARNNSATNLFTYQAHFRKVLLAQNYMATILNGGTPVIDAAIQQEANLRGISYDVLCQEIMRKSDQALAAIGNHEVKRQAVHAQIEAAKTLEDVENILGAHSLTLESPI